MSATVEQISEKIKFLPQEFLDRILGYIDALSEDKIIDEIPEWQKNEVRERIAEYKRNPRSAQDFDEAMNEVERDL